MFSASAFPEVFFQADQRIRSPKTLCLILLQAAPFEYQYLRQVGRLEYLLRCRSVAKHQEVKR